MKEEISPLCLGKALFARLSESSGNNKRGSATELRHNIPFENIIEILSWLPVESLVRFKCTCTQWSLLIERDRGFIQKQSVRGSYSMERYYRSRRGNDYVEAISDENFEFICTFGGLVLEVRTDSCHVARVRNPATRRVVYLPDAHKDACLLSFAFDASTGECKVVCTYSIKKENEELETVGGGGVGFEVLTIGKDEQWRPLKHPNQNLPELDDGDDAVRSSHSVCQTGSVVHVSEIIIDELGTYVEIYHLDLLTESFTSTTLTEGVVFSDLLSVRCSIWDDRLAVAEITDADVLNVLLLEDFKQPKCIEKKISIPLNFLKKDPHLKKGIFLYSASSNELQFHTGNWQFFRYDMTTEKTWFVEFAQWVAQGLSLKKSSLVNIQGMVPE